MSITGLFDVGYRATDVGNNTAKNTNLITSNNTGTSAFIFKINEDLGGGAKAYALAEADFAPMKTSLANGSTTNNGQWYTGAPFNSEQYVALAGGFGDIKLGAPNSPALVAGTTAQPFGTALGGGYSDTFGRLGANSNVGVSGYLGNATTGRVIRNERAAVYTTPTFSGFNGQIELAAKNDNAGAYGKATATGNTSGTNYSGNNNGYTGIAVNYNQGPLNAIAYTGKVSAGATAAAGAYSVGTQLVTANALAANDSIKYNMLAANYNLGATTVYGGYTTTKSTNAAAAAATNVVEDSKSWNLAAKYTVGQYDLLANYLKRTSNLAADDLNAPNGNAKLLGLGANYNFSKNSYAYVRYEKASNVVVYGAATNATANTYGDQKITAVGLALKF